ncbi:hypothetical protein AAFC00_000884 [Neodothiora populina]|uniref:DUF1365-domain-containing protein n=1 Tax=Neodothiora populina TaxID=2781224 RepID=A0ABR3PM28_9PEZI
MRATPKTSSLTSKSTGFEAAFVLWTIFASAQQYRQGRTTVAAFLQPLWFYRVKKHDRTALTDVLLLIGLHTLCNGLPTLQDLWNFLLPPWVLEQRIVELQIFGMISVMVLLAGAIVYRGEDRREIKTKSSTYVLAPVSFLSVAICLWLNNVRSTHDLLRLAVPLWVIEERHMELRTLFMVLLMVLCAGIIVWRGDEKPHIRFAGADCPFPEKYPLPPALIPGRTAHTRLFPQKHSFQYSYLSVGIPVGWTGCAGSVLSCDVEHMPSSKRRRGWFDVSADDFLTRGSHVCLEHKLSHYLHKQGVSDDDWSFAYLVTAPRFLGYSFNPVSFWYIYDSESNLTMMILEVNNTFDERRMYLLKAPPVPSKFDEYFPVTGLNFTSAWQKDFHVSPFNDREGTYSLTATDPIATFRSKNGKPIIDNQIILKTPEGATKLVARVFSSDLKDANTITNSDLALFLARWFWVGFVTFPRILLQAFKLHFRKHQPVWFRPEVLPSSISRAATPEETIIEACFRACIQDLVSNHKDRPLRVGYEPPEGMGHHHSFVGQGRTTVDEADEPDAVVRVLAPSFYSRFVHYPSIREAFDREGLATDEKNRTIIIEKATALHDLLSSSSSPVAPSEVAKNSPRISLTERIRWELLATLRCPPPAVSYATTSTTSSDTSSIQDTRALPSRTPLDLFVQEHCHEEKGHYVQAVIRLFLAERFLGGFTPLLGLVDLIIRLAIMVLLGAFVSGNWGSAFSALNLWAEVKGL